MEHTLQKNVLPVSSVAHHVDYSMLIELPCQPLVQLDHNVFSSNIFRI